MPLITRTERTDENAGLGISNSRIVYAAASQHLGLSPVTILAYLKWHGGSACIVDRSQSASVNGVRLNISSVTGHHWFGSRSGAGNFPVKYGDSANTVGQWRHIAAVWGGSHLASSITLYHADSGGVMTPSGSSSANDGGSASLYPENESSIRGLRLYNQSITSASDWPLRGDIAYVAIWKRELTQAELETARAEGPLNVHPDDLVLLRANGTDLSGYDATTTTEPAFPDGDLPPIMTLGGPAPLFISPVVRQATPDVIALPDAGLTIAPLERLLQPEPVALPSIQILDDFERCSIDLSQSTVGVDTDGVPLVSLRARRQTVTTMGTLRWLEPVAKLTGALGLMPRIEINPFQLSAGDGRNHQTWAAPQRAHYSYDGLAWLPISNKGLGSTRLTWRHNVPFEQDTVYVARSWPRSLTQVGLQVAALAVAHPDKVSPAPSAVSFTPANPHGFPAPEYICDELSAKTDELGRAVPVTPLYGFLIDDSAFGQKSRTAVVTMGIHSGEDVGEVVWWEVLDYLLGTSETAQALREKTRILVYPLVNPAGRWAGYWRGAPGSNTDPNREWNISTPTHDCVVKMKAVMLADTAALGRPVAWAFDVHASPGGDGVLQLGVNETRPETVAFDAFVRSRYPAGSWADYSDRTVPPSPTPGDTLTSFHRHGLGATLVMLNETTDKITPISPSVMRPYAEAQVGALADMDADGWFGSSVDGVIVADGTSSSAVFVGEVEPPDVISGEIVAFGAGGNAVVSGGITISGVISAVGAHSSAAISGEVGPPAGVSGAIVAAGSSGAADLYGHITVSGVMSAIGAHSSALLAGIVTVAGTIAATGGDSVASLWPGHGTSGAMLVTLDRAKKHLRVDFDDDDEMITLQIEAASAAVIAYLARAADVFLNADGTVPTDVSTGDPVGIPPRVQQAVLITVGYLYRERDGSQEYAVAAQFGYGYMLPQAATSLLYSARKPTVV